MRRFGRIILILLAVCLVLASVGVTVGAVYLSRYADAKADLRLLELHGSGEPARLYAYAPDRRAARRGEVHETEALSGAGRYLFVDYHELPDDLKNAFVAIEDKRFYKHRGVDLWRTVSAGFHYLKGGSRSFGASTITQQLIKNLTGHDEYTLDRKFTEIFEALDLEKRAEKSEILTCYLNVINLANGCRGVGAAAEYYFGKSVSELTTAECACIAAITNNPSLYDPIAHPENNRKRRELILGEMHAQGYLDDGAYKAAMNDDVIVRKNAPTNTAGYVNSWYTDLVISDVIHDLQVRLGYTKTEATMAVYAGGLSIYTVVDEEMQRIVESYFAEESYFPTGDAGRPQSSMILIDPHTGDVLAVAGAVGEKVGNRLQNYATDTRRPAGSTLKPLAIYAPALERGIISWSSVYEDEPIVEKENGRLWPRNADGLYRGRVTVDEAVAHSINTVPVKILDELGVEETFDFLHDRLHMTSLVRADERGQHDMTVSSLALGQQSGGVTARELTAAYTVFDRGVYHAPISYHRVVDADGRVLLENSVGGERVLSGANATVMTRLLCGVVTDGTASGRITLPDTLGVEVAGKTGTTQNNCDRWFVGYTPRLLGGVWMGYDYPAELRGINGNASADVWNEVLSKCEQVYRGSAPQDSFRDHPDALRVTYCTESGGLPCPSCVTDGRRFAVREGWFARGTEPSEGCDVHNEAWMNRNEDRE